MSKLDNDPEHGSRPRSFVGRPSKYSKEELRLALGTIGLTLIAFTTARNLDASSFIQWLILCCGSIAYAIFDWKAFNKELGGPLMRYIPQTPEQLLLKELVSYVHWTCVFVWCILIGIAFIIS